MGGVMFVRRILEAQARRRFVPFMRQLIDLPGLYRDALRAMPETLDAARPLPVPDVCPVTLDGLLSDQA